LRIGRLEGFVPYDEFVERKLGAAYALIDLISARFERIKADVTVLRQIETAQHNRVVQEITLELQLSADVALFIFLLPYYAGSVWFERILRLEGGAATSRLAWLALWLAFVLFAVHKPGPLREFVLSLPGRFQLLSPLRQGCVIVAVLLVGMAAEFLLKLYL